MTPSSQELGSPGNPGRFSATLNLNHNPGKGASDVNLPQGFNNDVSVDCAIIGLFHIIQYRINPLPPAVSPSLERRDLAFA